MNVTAWAGFAVGVLICLGTASSVVATMVVPRRVRSRASRYTANCLSVVFRSFARMSKRYETRDRVLAVQAPTFLLVLLIVWMSMFILGFALMYLPFLADHSFAAALEVSSSSFFTVGFAATSAQAPVLTAIDAGVGLIVIALQIAYLPVIYGSFNRREVLVTLLDSRAGSPAWGPEILARHELVDNVDNLVRMYERWEEWAADVAESHTNYPVLITFRSPDPLRSWVTGLLAVLDAAALHMATRPLTAPPAARVMIRMGYVALRDIGQSMEIRYDDDPKPEDPISLTREDFDDALHLLAHVDWPMERDADEAWVHFRGWRVNYEKLAYAIADAIDAPPAPWSGPRGGLLASQFRVPIRPPHREPTPEVDRIRDETAARRAARGLEPPGTSLAVEDFHRDH